MNRQALARLATILLVAGLVAVCLQPEPGDAQLVRAFCRRASEDPATARELGEGPAFLETTVTLHRHQQLHLAWCALGPIEAAGRALAPVGQPAPRRWKATPPAPSGVRPVVFVVGGPRQAPRILDVDWPEPAVRPEPLPWWRRDWL